RGPDCGAWGGARAADGGNGGGTGAPHRPRRERCSVHGIASEGPWPQGYRAIDPSFTSSNTPILGLAPSELRWRGTRRSHVSAEWPVQTACQPLLNHALNRFARADGLLRRAAV